MDPYKGQQAYVVGLRTLLEIPRFTTACSHDHDCNIKVHDSRPRLCKILNKFPSLAAKNDREALWFTERPYGFGRVKIHQIHNHQSSQI